jgi:hypothetical protein
MLYIWIIEKSTSAALFYRSYSDLMIDPDLVSGLLSALNNFSEVELKARGIEAIDMAGLRWVYVGNDPLNLLIIAADVKTSNDSVMRSRLEVIEKMFIQQYKITPETWDQKLININQFSDFAAVCDMLRDQWKQAEKVVGAAQLFDMLGVFQQIINVCTDIIRENFFGTKREEIFKQVGVIFAELKELPEVKGNEELQKITYDSQQGWNVITLNPTILDELTLKRTLFFITKRLKRIIHSQMGLMQSMKAFNKELIPFVFTNWELLEQLQMNKSILQVFLEINPQ